MVEAEQAARARLRLGFLLISTRLCGRAAVLTTCQGNTLQCVLGGRDRAGQRMAVQQLATPTGILDEAVVRTPDLDIVHLPAQQRQQ